MNALFDHLNNKKIHFVVFSRSKTKSLEKVTIRLIQLQNKEVYQTTEVIANKAIHKNYPLDEIKQLIEKFDKDYNHLLLKTIDEEFEVLTNKKNEKKILKRSHSSKLAIKHNSEKKTILPLDQPIEFLIELGIMSRDGKIKNDKRDKLHQINQFLLIVEQSLKNFAFNEKISLIDFGCGKSYLTFSLYYFLKIILKKEVEIVGIDLKEDMVLFCNQLTQKLGWENLKFQQGSIDNFQSDHKINMIVALHACNTATDAVIEQGIKNKVKVLLLAPCCHQELYNQIKNPLLNPILKHGILKEKFAAIVTDALRGLLLESNGYKVQIMEFVDPTHTPKNILIKAIKKDHLSKIEQEKALSHFLELKESLQVYPNLEKRLFN
ncbi:Methyltransferase TRM13 [Candidatus Rubidus massiliensis]|nr:Methyltransferase TRM13 [Candidatus Rubidus massiliensis]